MHEIHRTFIGTSWNMPVNYMEHSDNYLGKFLWTVHGIFFGRKPATIQQVKNNIHGHFMEHAWKLQG